MSSSPIIHTLPEKWSYREVVITNIEADFEYGETWICARVREYIPYVPMPFPETQMIEDMYYEPKAGTVRIHTEIAQEALGLIGKPVRMLNQHIVWDE